MSTLTALALCCSLKPSPSPSSSDKLAQEMLDALKPHGVEGSIVRIADHKVAFGVSIDEGDEDGWPEIRKQIMGAEILIISTPIWMGHPSSICQMVMERLDAELSEKDSQGRLLTYGKVAAIGVVGNEDGAHNVTAQVMQSLNDVGFTFAAGGATYWVGEAMASVDYNDLSETPEKVATTTKSLAANTAHLAAILKDKMYPA